MNTENRREYLLGVWSIILGSTMIGFMSSNEGTIGFFSLSLRIGSLFLTCGLICLFMGLIIAIRTMIDTAVIDLLKAINLATETKDDL